MPAPFTKFSCLRKGSNNIPIKDPPSINASRIMIKLVPIPNGNNESEYS